MCRSYACGGTTPATRVPRGAIHAQTPPILNSQTRELKSPFPCGLADPSSGRSTAACQRSRSEAHLRLDFDSGNGTRFEQTDDNEFLSLPRATPMVLSSRRASGRGSTSQCEASRSAVGSSPSSCTCHPRAMWHSPSPCHLVCDTPSPHAPLHSAYAFRGPQNLRGSSSAGHASGAAIATGMGATANSTLTQAQGEDNFVLRFRHKCECGPEETVYFAFCFPDVRGLDRTARVARSDVWAATRGDPRAHIRARAWPRSS